MTHRFAAMRGDPPIPEIDVSKPALAPTRVIPDGAIPAEDVPELMRRLIPHVKIEAEPIAPEPAAPEFVEGERVMCTEAGLIVDGEQIWAAGNWGSWWSGITLLKFRRPTPDELRKYWPEDVPTDGWIAWKGGECPVPLDTRVEVMMSGGSRTVDSHFAADAWRWSHIGSRGDIIAYKVLP